MNFFDKIKFAKAFFALVENPQATDNVFKIGKIGLKHPDSPGIQNMLKHVFANDEFQRQYAKGYFPDYVKLENLRSLPEGTLGKEFYHHMTKNGLDVEFFPKEKLNLPAKYVVMRLRSTHDLWHVLAGYDTSPVGELCLQAFYLGQVKSSIAAILIGAGFLGAAKVENGDGSEFLEKIYPAYERGKRAKFMLSLKYENLWSKPLSEIRQDLNIR